MLVREQGRTIQLIRVERTPGAMRTTQRVIGTLPSKTLVAALTADERTTLERWLAARHQQHHRQALDQALPCLAEHAAAIDVAAEQFSPTDAHAIWKELDTLTRVLKRVDYSRPARQPASPATPPMQGDLLP
ncbi:hypothetical protein [Ralstonia sp. 1138]|uniref:hypothetical protein n=1 Tax=Ralstonia sp. 1138 TaxID=3156423 RepID=UPI003394C90C